ncbi:MAG TPA: hypothetical protein VGF75_00370 [Candidatus Saccharimonadales bacterium]|jgi:hypothetical protein
MANCINCDGDIDPTSTGHNPDFCSLECEQEFTSSADSELLTNSGISIVPVPEKSQAQNLPDGKTFSTLIDADGNLKK